jgi:hypothetical protein
LEAQKCNCALVNFQKGSLARLSKYKYKYNYKSIAPYSSHHTTPKSYLSGGEHDATRSALQHQLFKPNHTSVQEHEAHIRLLAQQCARLAPRIAGRIPRQCPVLTSPMDLQMSAMQLAVDPCGK